ncbi:MAG: hypothetical protein MRY49_01930 [Candidatus Pacebacteria bacterium]|nr:hypothetical protein [Candidatus Paceibacterota bacterium]
MINSAIAVTALAVLAGAGAKRMPKELLYPKKTALGICITLFAVASIMFLIGIIQQTPH